MSVSGSGGYERYWQGCFRVFREDIDIPLSKFVTAHNTAMVKGDILRQLHSFVVSPSKYPASFPLHDIGNYTKPLKGAAWEVQFEANLGHHPAQIVASDIEFLGITGKLFGKYDDRQLVELDE